MNKNVKIARELVKLAKSLVTAGRKRFTYDDVDNQLENMGFDSDDISKKDKKECIDQAMKTCNSYPELDFEDCIEVLEQVLWKKLKDLGIEEV